MSVPYNVRDLYSGVLHKCGAKIKSWNKRWFVLKSDYCLYYYKDTAKGHLGVITLRDPKFKVRRGTVGDTAWPKGVTMERTIAVVTSHRTYCMYGTNADEAEEWIKVLDKTREKLIEEANSPTRLPGRSYSETMTNNIKEETRSKLFSESFPSPGQPALLEHEETYEAVYDSPEADLSQNNSPNDTPSLNTKVPHTNSTDSRQRITSGVETDSIYDLANAEETGHDENQPLYAEAAAPENEEELDEPSAVYDDVEVRHDGGEKRESLKGGGDPSQDVYDDVAILGVTNSEANAVIGNDTAMELYEPIDTTEHTPSAKNLPLPPVPLASHAPSGGDGPLPIYEDIPDPKADKPQPLYEEMSTESPATRDRYVPESEGSEDEGEGDTGPVPPLPPKDDLPPLPPKDSVPELPPKNSPPTSRNVPSLPPKEAANVPLLPPKDDVTNDQSNKRGIPPLPPKEEVTEENRQPVAPPRQSQTIVPPSPPPHRRRSSGSSEGSLSPSTQKKPVPKERTLTPPLPASTKPLPAPRRRASPTASPDQSLESSHINGHSHGHAHSSAPPSFVAPVTVQVTSPGEEEEFNLHGNAAVEGEKGMELFKKRRELVKKQSETDIKNRTESIRTMTNVTSDPNISPHHKAVFSETMREIEHERLLASEERFKWERERLKLEEERRRFEEEKRKLQEEIEQTRRQLQLQGRS